jgi:hypothetical protein
VSATGATIEHRLLTSLAAVRARGNRRVLVALVTLVLAVAALVGVPAGTAAAEDYYGLAGYSVPIDVTSAGAEWRIPAVAPGSPLGHARTLLRLSFPASGVEMEVGTTEDEVVFHHRHVAVYSAFWNRIGLGPTRLATLHAGDLVRVSALKREPNWRLTISDLTSGWTDSVLNPGVGATTVTAASWFQEDPVTGPAVPAAEQEPVLPYPSVGPVTFTHLVLNGSEAVLPWSDSQDMMLSDGAFAVPTHESAGRFSVVPPSRYQRQYLRDAVVFDYAARRFQYVVQQQWTSSMDGSTRFATARPYLAAIRTFVHDLSTQRWPVAVRADLRNFVQSEEQVVSVYDELPGLSASQISGWQATAYKVRKLNVTVGAQVRVDLGLPPGV